MMDVLDPKQIRLHQTGSGSPIVFLHCLGVDRHMWDFAVRDLSRDFSLLRYDLPGHGETPVPTHPYRIEDLSEQLAAVLSQSGSAHAHVVGISMGGLVAQHFAATCAAQVDRLILIDTTPRYTDDLRRMWAQRAATARSAGVESLAEELLKIWFTPEFLAQDPPAVQYVRDRLARTSGEGYALACEALAAADLQPITPRISAPTLVVCGDRDIPSFLDSANWLAKNISHARLEWLSPARHASVLEQPQTFLRLVREFLI